MTNVACVTDRLVTRDLGPAETVTVAIEADQTTSRELKIESLPALAELSAPDATGTRTLHQVPFSVIGLKP